MYYVEYEIHCLLLINKYFINTHAYTATAAFLAHAADRIAMWFRKGDFGRICYLRCIVVKQDNTATVLFFKSDIELKRELSTSKKNH